jgi:membrane-bound lytic murein transglycosylase F
MSHPASNIHGGVYYMKRLYNLFEGSDPSDRLKLTLAAYNAGLGRVYDARDIAAYLHEDPNTWESVRNALPLLSKRYYTLHRSVWEDARPSVGWFGNSRETLTYVDRIMDTYEEYQLVLN